MFKYFKRFFSSSSKTEQESSEPTIKETRKTLVSPFITEQVSVENPNILDSENYAPVYQMTKNMKMVLSGNKNNQEMSNIIKAANKIAPHETPQNVKKHSKKKSEPLESTPFKKLNLCTDIIDFAKRSNSNLDQSILKNPDPHNIVNIQSYLEKISNSVKFILPSDAVIVEGGIKEGSWKDRYAPYINHFKLPYDCLIMEMEYRLKVKVYLTPEGDKSYNDTQSLPLIFLCEQKEDHIEITVFLREGNHDWFIVNRSPIILLNDFSSPFMRNGAEYIGDERAVDFLSNLTQMAAHAVLDLIMLTNCSNVEISEELSSGKFINQKRIKKGKTPFFDYKVLTLNFASSASNDPHKESGSMKRSHLRRGHIRRLKDRTIWVNACSVNGGAKGQINKDYKLTKTAI